MSAGRPVSNKILARKWKDMDDERHRKNLSQIKSSIDNKPPKKYSHLDTRLKKKQMEEERNSQIQRDNTILLAKMAEIATSDGLIDNSPPEKESSSLNYPYKKRESERIEEENQKLLGVMLKQKGVMDFRSMDRDWEKNKTYASQIRQYPSRPKSQTQNRPMSQTQRGQSGSGEKRSRSGPESRTSMRNQSRTQSRTQSTPGQSSPGKGPGGRQAKPKQTPPVINKKTKKDPQPTPEEESDSEDYAASQKVRQEKSESEESNESPEQSPDSVLQQDTERNEEESQTKESTSA
ncbi:putative KIAA1430 like protein [Blattamonas nauphoetae]|uniref:KIAA1430 like protein n=1 Tax=Blattamonas nauphoetae TaxID=2049346 RepID=A0ABQ9Y4P3_9EUKA|nr:putative KIAA1430 like protein [Blattamonas nauphoetae]